MLVTKTRNEFIALYNQMSDLDDLTGAKFAYAIHRIKSTLFAEFKRLRELNKAKPGYIDYEGKRTELCEELADKDEKGNPMIDGGQYLITERKDEFDQRFEALKVEYSSVLAERAEFAAMLNDEVEMDFYDIAKDWIPENITVKQAEIIAPFLTKE